MLRDAAIMAGCPHGALTAGHVDRIDALVTGWRGQRWVDLPGGVRARPPGWQGVVHQQRTRRQFTAAGHQAIDRV